MPQGGGMVATLPYDGSNLLLTFGDEVCPGRRDRRSLARPDPDFEIEKNSAIEKPTASEFDSAPNSRHHSGLFVAHLRPISKHWP